MESTANTSKPNIQFGLILGVLLILAFVVMYTLDIDVVANRTAGTISSVLNNLILPVIFISLACTAYKKNNNGFISFGKALKVGVGTVFIAAILFAIFNLIFNFIFPEYAEHMLLQTKQIMLQQKPNMTSKETEMALSMTRKFMSPWFSFPVIVVTLTFFGLIYSLIIGAIVKKDQPQSF